MKKEPRTMPELFKSSLGRTKSLGERDKSRDPYLTVGSLLDSSSTGKRVLSEKHLSGSFCRDQLHNRNKNALQTAAKYPLTLERAYLRSLHPVRAVSPVRIDG
jgi:hypothetical protein